MLFPSAAPSASYRGAQTLHAVTRFLLLLFPVSLLVDRATPDVFMSTIAILFVVHCALARDLSWLRARWLQAVLLLWVYLVLRNLLVDHWQDRIGLVICWVRFPAFAAAIVFWLARDASTLRWLLTTISATFVYILGDTLFQYFNYTDLIGRPSFVGTDVLRLTGPFIRPRVGITLASLALPLLLYYARAYPGKKWVMHLLALGLLILTILDVYLSGERMALILLMTGLVVGAFLYPPFRRPMLAAIVAGLVVGAVFSHYNSELATRQIKSTDHVLGDFWDSPYGLPWLSALHMGTQRPLFGVGYKHFTPACLLNPPAPDQIKLRCPMHPHNPYLEWLAESGLVGLSLFLAMVGFVLRDIWQSRKLWCGDALMTGLVVALLLRFWPISASASQFAAWHMMPFWLYLAWFYSLLAQKRSALDGTN